MLPVRASGQELLFELRRKLSAIGIETQFSARGDTLKGKLALEGAQVIPNPLGEAPIDRITFSIDHDGMLHIDQPEPAHGLKVPEVVSFASVDELAEALRDAVDARAARLRGHALRLSTLGMEYELDAERLALTARVDLGHLGVAELDSNGERVIARELVDASGSKRKSFDELELDLESFEDRLDLELFITPHAEALVPDRAAQSIVSGHLAPAMHATPDVDSVLNTEDELELEPEFEIELDDELGTLVAGLPPPRLGQMWAMEVRVESDDGEEIRYKGVNVAGGTYGAPRVLPKIAFEVTYIADKKNQQSHRMRVQISSVDDENVHYVKLDAQLRPVGPERSVSAVGFLANFVLDAGAI